MSSPERVQAFNDSSTKLLAWQSKQDSLVSRPGRWGDHDFSESAPYFSRVFQMTQDFAGLSVDLLDDSTLDQLTGTLNALLGEFEHIDQLDTVGMVNTQDIIASNVQANHDAMLEVYKREIAWLTMFAGRMENWLAQAKSDTTKRKLLGRGPRNSPLRRPKQPTSPARRPGRPAQPSSPEDTELVRRRRQRPQSVGLSLPPPASRLPCVRPGLS